MAFKVLPSQQGTCRRMTQHVCPFGRASDPCPGKGPPNNAGDSPTLDGAGRSYGPDKNVVIFKGWAGLFQVEENRLTDILWQGQEAFSAGFARHADGSLVPVQVLEPEVCHFTSPQTQAAEDE